MQNIREIMIEVLKDTKVMLEIEQEDDFLTRLKVIFTIIRESGSWVRIREIFLGYIHVKTPLIIIDIITMD